MSDKYSKDDAYQTLELINSWINNIDTKTSFALAYIGVLIGFAFANGAPDVFVKLSSTNTITAKLVIKLAFVLALYTTSLAAIIFLFVAIAARIKNESGKKSTLFFGTIAAMSLSNYMSKVMNMGKKEIEKDLIEQVHTNSKICVQKAKMYNRGIVCVIAATICCFISIAFGII